MKKIILFIIGVMLCSYSWATDYCSTADICWTLEDGSGTTTDDKSSNALDGTFKSSGNPAWDNTSAPTNYSWYVNPSDRDDYITATDDSSLDYIENSDDFTCYMNIYFSDSSYSNVRFISKQEGTSGDGWGILNNTSDITFYKDNGGTQEDEAIAHGMSSSQWNNLFIQYDNSEGKFRLYVNKSATSYSDALSSNGDLYGFSSDGKFYVLARSNGNGSDSNLAAVACWDSLLTTTQMDDISDNGLIPSNVSKTLKLYQPLKTYQPVKIGG